MTTSEIVTVKEITDLMEPHFLNNLGTLIEIARYMKMLMKEKTVSQNHIILLDKIEKIIELSNEINNLEEPIEEEE